MASPAELLPLIDAAIEQLLLDGTAEVEVRGQRYRSIDLDALISARGKLAVIAAQDVALATRGGHAPVIQAVR